MDAHASWVSEEVDMFLARRSRTRSTDRDESHSSGTFTLPAFGWSLYDLANSTFQTNILVLYFPLWVVNDLGARDSHYAVASSISMALVLVSAPLLGALSDHTGRRLPFLAVSTVLCAAFTAFLGVRSPLAALAVFVGANYFFQAGAVFYDALLPSVSTEGNRGRVGGWGLGLGYLGSFLGVLAGTFLIARLGPVAAKPHIFELTAALFLVLALPCFVFVKESAGGARAKLDRAALRDAASRVRRTAALMRQHPGAARFLVGRVLYADAINTFTAFIGVYLVKDIGFAASQVQGLLVGAIIGAVAGSLVGGATVDRIGPRRPLHLALALWAAALVAAFAVAAFDLPRLLMWFVMPVGGFAVAAIWAADRPYLLCLSPPNCFGQFYGLYSTAGRFGSVVGPLLWAAVVDGLGLGRPAAVGSLIALVGVAYLVLRTVPEHPLDHGPAAIQAAQCETVNVPA